MSPSSNESPRPVYVVDGLRTPFLKAKGVPGPFTAVDLATYAGRALLLRQPELAARIDEVILGCAAPGADAPNPARVSALRMGLPDRTPAFTVQRNCGSGMQSVDIGYKYIRDGHADVILAGGVESMSHAPLLLDVETARWLGDLGAAESMMQRINVLERFRPRMLKPTIGLEKGLTDSIADMNMGQTAELLAHEWNISRSEADAYAAESHRRLAAAFDAGALEHEVEPLITPEGRVLREDEGLRRDSTEEHLARLKPAFEPPYGQVTAGNSSQITDGACWLLLVSAPVADALGLAPLGRIADSQWAALDPARMGLGPTLAVPPLLARQGLTPPDIARWELNEAFAAQVLGCLKAWQDADYCREKLGLDAPFGEIDRDRLNPDGGAISLGHPVGTSGARIVLHALNALGRSGGDWAVASECIGGGQAGAMLVGKVGRVDRNDEQEGL